MPVGRIIFLVSLNLLLPVLASTASAGLPVTNGLTLHLDAETLNLTDGAAVSLWPAVVGPDATQSNSLYRPVYRAIAIPNVVSDRPAVDFGGSKNEIRGSKCFQFSVLIVLPNSGQSPDFLERVFIGYYIDPFPNRKFSEMVLAVHLVRAAHFKG